MVASRTSFVLPFVLFLALTTTAGASGTYVLQPGPEGKDTCYGTSYVVSGCPDNPNLYIGGWGDAYYDFFEFDLTGSPQSADTTKAELWLYGNAPNDPAFQIYRVTQPWTETGVTLANNPSSTLYKSMGPVPQISNWIVTDITDLYKAWKDNVYPNYGIKLAPTSNNQTNGSIASSDNSDATLRPKLVIIYAAATVSAPDCFFNWVEKNYPSLFSPPAASQTASPYYYRYYSATKAYLGTSSSDSHLYYVAANAVSDLGLASTWYGTAACTQQLSDVTPPVTTTAPSVSGTTSTATTLSATINENGTGYYLVQAATAVAPTVAAVLSGTSFAMTANVAATVNISGLTFSTAYKIYFIAKDAANNVQAAIASVAVTTATAVLPAGYVVQGGLTWTPAALLADWATANNYCTRTTINGQTGWRLPTLSELSSMANSGKLNAGYYVWSSTPYPTGGYYVVYLDPTRAFFNGTVDWEVYPNGDYVTCVHSTTTTPLPVAN